MLIKIILVTIVYLISLIPGITYLGLNLYWAIEDFTITQTFNLRNFINYTFTIIGVVALIPIMTYFQIMWVRYFLRQ